MDNNDDSSIVYERQEVIIEQISLEEMLKEIKLENLLHNFVSEGMDMEILLTMDENDIKECLREIGIKRFGDRHKINQRILIEKRKSLTEKRKSLTGKRKSLTGKRKSLTETVNNQRKQFPSADETDLNTCDENLLQDTDARDSTVNDLSKETLPNQLPLINCNVICAIK